MNELDQLNQTINEWRKAEDESLQAQDSAKALKAKVEERMHELGLKSLDAESGKVSIYPVKSLTWLVTDKQREAMLKQHGLYDQFCSTKLDLTKVKRYVEQEDDSLFGMVEPTTTYAIRFTGKGV